MTRKFGIIFRKFWNNFGIAEGFTFERFKNITAKFFNTKCKKGSSHMRN